MIDTGRDLFMKHEARRVLGVLGSMLVFASGSASAQETSVGAATSEAQRRIQILRAWEITRALKLSPDEAAKVLTVLATYDEKRREALSKMRGASKNLRKLTRTKTPDEPGVKAEVDTYLSARDSLNQAVREEFDELRKLLSPLQQGKYLLAQAKFRRTLKKVLDKVKTEREGKQDQTASPPR